MITETEALLLLRGMAERTAEVVVIVKSAGLFVKFVGRVLHASHDKGISVISGSDHFLAVPVLDFLEFDFAAALEGETDFESGVRLFFPSALSVDILQRRAS